MIETPYHFMAGDSPLLVSMPHVGTELPHDIARQLTPEAQKVLDTDWYVDRLYDFLGDFPRGHGGVGAGRPGQSVCH